MKQNLIIRASAGTGKTFSLATRFIRLMLFLGVKPDRIVALTFSRAAAQEIYMKLLDRLTAAALSDAGAAKEKDLLLKDLSAEDRAAVERAVGDWSHARFAALLKDVIDTQHHGTIATLDSFILRIVRSFPLEMGFQHAVDILDGYGEKRALTDARTALLARTDEHGAFAAAFRAAADKPFAYACSRVLEGVLANWRNFLLTHRDAANWDAAGICRALGVPADPVRPSTAALPVTDKCHDPFAAIVKALDAFSGTGEIFPKNKGGELMAYFFDHPAATGYPVKMRQGDIEMRACAPDVAPCVAGIVRYMLAVKVNRIATTVAAKLRLCQSVEREYDVSTRRRGLLTFADVTDCQAGAERDADMALKLENLQFRFDTRFDHWALDEFQDTSELQWQCLGRLVREAAQPGGGNRSVMAVGDLKQSIYTWRGGNDAPFKEMMNAWDEFKGERGEIVPNAISFRYAKNTADFINRVFGPENIRDGGVLPAGNGGAVARWLEEDCWMPHRADSRNGRERDDDFVEVIAVSPPEDGADAAGGESPAEGDEAEGGGAALRMLAPNLCACVADLWQRHEAAHSTDTVGILVRNNRDGLALAECLRNCETCKLPVVWEGVDGVLDAPIVRTVLELLKLAEHPQDTFAWAAVEKLSPLREIVFPGMKHVGSVSAAVALMLSRQGLARTLREIVSRILASDKKPDARSILRLEALVREGVNYEQRPDAAQGVLRFIAYLATATGRAASDSPHVIRILTIHRSKGLTLDHVIVPILENARTDAITKPHAGTPLVGPGWALESVSEAEARLLPALDAAWRQASDACVLEQLRLNYVALTRARKSTHVFVCDDAHPGRVQFRDLLTHPFAETSPDRSSPFGRLVCALGAMPPFGRKAEAFPLAPTLPWPHASGRERIQRRTPSATAPAGASGHRHAPTFGSFFADGKSAAAEAGIAEHAAYAQISWIDPAAPKDERESRILRSPWAEAFVRRDGVADLWVERRYEFFEHNVWETGQFDRVVFTGADATRTATVYDFKTNRPFPGETPADFAGRIARQYAEQMRTYRHALNVLTHIPAERIRLVLLLQATADLVDVEPTDASRGSDAQES